MSGAFLTSREIFENPIWQNIVEFRLFFLIYGKAIFSEEGYKQGNVFIGKGQWLRSYRNLQSDLEYIENRSVKKYSLSTIKRAVDNLVKDGRIKIENTELGTLFTVVNYARYQGLDNYKKNIENAERTQSERRQNNNKKEKNDKNDKNNPPIVPPVKKSYAEFVTMTEDEYKKLLTKYGKEKTVKMIEILDNYKGASGKKYKSDYRAILSWVVKRVEQEEQQERKGGYVSGKKRRLSRQDERDWEKMLGID